MYPYPYNTDKVNEILAGTDIDLAIQNTIEQDMPILTYHLFVTKQKLKYPSLYHFIKSNTDLIVPSVVRYVEVYRSELLELEYECAYMDWDYIENYEDEILLSHRYLLISILLFRRLGFEYVDKNFKALLRGAYTYSKEIMNKGGYKELEIRSNIATINTDLFIESNIFNRESYKDAIEVLVLGMNNIYKYCTPKKTEQNAKYLNLIKDTQPILIKFKNKVSRGIYYITYLNVLSMSHFEALKATKLPYHFKDSGWTRDNFVLNNKEYTVQDLEKMHADIDWINVLKSCSQRGVYNMIYLDEKAIRPE